MSTTFGRRRLSLRTKIIAWSLVPTVIILSAIALLSIYAYQRVAEDLVMERNRELARLTAGQVATEMGEYVGVLSAIARTEPMMSSFSIVRQMALKDVSNRLVVFDAGVIILDNYGKVTASEPERPDVIGIDWSSRSYFRQMVRSPGIVFSDVLADGPGGSQVIVVAVPITGGRGEFFGSMVGMFRLGVRTVSAFYGSLVKLRLGGSAVAYLVDGTGRVIYHNTDADQIGADFSHVEGVQRVLKGQVGSLRTKDVGERPIVSSFAPIPGTPWGLVTEESLGRLLSPSRGYQRFLMLLLALGVALPSLLAAVGAGRIVKPIVDLTQAAKEVADGKFGQTITATTGDEVEDLARQFNTMSAELQESYATLERRVADRTRDLAALNEVGTVVSGSLDLQEILSHALEKTMEVVGTESGAAYRLDDATQTLEIMAHRGLSEAFVTAVAHLPLSIALAGRRLVTDQPIVWPIADYPAGALRDHISQEGLRLVIGVPLMAKERLLGALILSTHGMRSLSPEESSLLVAVGRQVGLAVENARLYEQAEVTAISAERQRLARELHDAVTQTLFSASLIADVLPRLWERNQEEGRRRLAELRALTRGALAEMRTLLHELRPASLTEMALGDLLRQLAEAMTGRVRVPVELDVQSQCALPPHVQVALYRIAQEALNNVAKHAGASKVQVALRCTHAEASGPPGFIELSISDNGAGFEVTHVSPEHLGLGIMQERAAAIEADLTIDSVPGRGTAVTVMWPGKNARRMEQG